MLAWLHSSHASPAPGDRNALSVLDTVPISLDYHAHQRPLSHAHEIAVGAELPVADRNSQELVGLSSGVTPPEQALDTVRDPDRNRFYSTNGQLPGANLNMADGVANLEPFLKRKG